MDCDTQSTSKNPIESATASSTPTASSHLGLLPRPPSNAPPCTLPNVLPLMCQNEFEMPHPKKKSRTALEVWEHFKRIEVCDHNDLTASCNYCGKDFACDTKRNGTSTMRNHLHLCKKYPYDLEDPNHKVITFRSRKEEEGECTGFQVMAFNNEACRAACVRMIIKDELPFTFMEGEGFREFCAEACPKFDPPSRTTIARDVYQIYLEEKKKLKSFFMNNSLTVSLTTDTWTSIQNINYMVLTAHFVDNDWKLQKKILNFCQIPDHKGETIGKLIEGCLIEWHIERVFTITMDDAKINDVAISYLRRKLKNWKNGCVLDGEFFHMRCCAHITNLIVNDGLNEHSSSIDVIRKAVKYVMSSPSRLQYFKACVKKERIESKRLLALDVSTRWNSTYLMLEAACTFEKAFDRMEEDDEYEHGQYVAYFEGVTPQALDWERARILVRFLKTFYDVTLTFSASLKVNSNLFISEFSWIEELLLKWIVDKDVIISDMATSMKVKLDKYWGSIGKINKLLFVAHVLDPRFKLCFIQLVINKLYPQDVCDEILKGVKDALHRLFEFYVALTSPPPTTQSSKDVQPTNVANVSSGHNETKGLMWEFNKRRKIARDIYIKNEIDRYLKEPDEDVDVDNAMFDVLEWWKVNSTKYKVLSLLARDVFAIPLSTVASESAFSTRGRILDPYKSSLTPKMVEALICSQNWIRSIHLPLDIRVYDECFELCQDVEKDSSEAWSSMLKFY